MKKILLATALILELFSLHTHALPQSPPQALPQALPQPPPQAPQALPANTPSESLNPGQWVWYVEEPLQGSMRMLINITQQKAYLYRNGVLVAASTVSTGKQGYDTPTGVFTILQKNKYHRSNLYKDSNNRPAAMPYMQRLTWDGIALHSGKVPGYPTSHGCIRLPEGFAQRLFSETELGMTVIVSKDKFTGPQYEAYRWQPEKSPFGPLTVLGRPAATRQ
jgi:lipoprotein-anchoring transpeptidase ErfK/SrfK